MYTSETRDQLLTLVKAIHADIESDLATYDIRDDNTILGFYAVLSTVALLEEDWRGYLDWLAKRRARYPDLRAAQIKAAIIDKADGKALETRSIRLINPRSSVELAASLR